MFLEEFCTSVQPASLLPDKLKCHHNCAALDKMFNDRLSLLINPENSENTFKEKEWVSNVFCKICELFKVITSSFKVRAHASRFKLIAKLIRKFPFVVVKQIF